MPNIVLLIISIIGVSLTLLFREQNLFLFFFGLCMLLMILLTFLIKKFASKLYLPFIVISGAGLFLFSRLDFHPNMVSIVFVEPNGYSAFFLAGEQEFPPNTILPDLPLKKESPIQITFQKQPSLSGADFILLDMQNSELTMDLIWSWATKANHFNELVDINFASPMKELIIKSEDNSLNLIKKVLVNGKALNWTESKNGLHYFSFVSEEKTIDNIQITETTYIKPHSIKELEASFTTIYVIESEPAPIILNNISLTKNFSRLNQIIPFYKWDATSILTDFNAGNGYLELKGEGILLTPETDRLNLTLLQSPSVILESGLLKLRPYIMAVYGLVSLLSLTTFSITALFLNQYFETIKQKCKRVWSWGQSFIVSQPTTYRIHRITPFKILFSIFLLLSWFLFIKFSVSFHFMVIAFMLSIILVYYIASDIEFKK